MLIFDVHESCSTNHVGMGGTYQVDDWNTKPAASDRKYILEAVAEYLPSLKVISSEIHGS